MDGVILLMKESSLNKQMYNIINKRTFIGLIYVDQSYYFHFDTYH